MKKLALLTFVLFSIKGLHAQSNRPPQESPGGYFNSFQGFTYATPNADSAVFYLRKLAGNEMYIGYLRDLLHDSFAQAFRKGKDEENTDTAQARRSREHKLLSIAILERAMTDTLQRLTKTIRPIYLWYQIQQYQDDAAKVTPLIKEFINKELPGALYTDKAARYGLMICLLIEKHPSLKDAIAKIRSIIYDNLGHNQVALTDSITRGDLDKRAWYRYMYAYMNYTAAKATNDPKAKEKYLKLAYDYSPDIADRNHRAAYFYDMMFLFDEEREDFKEDYVTFLTNSGKSPETILNMLREMALIAPQHRARLRDYYNSHNKTTKSFNTYWVDAINASAKEAPPIVLNLLDNKSFSTKQLLGKWVVIDFWGTWCAPCRAEHPDMQKFYDSTVLKKPGDISLLTIACRDTEDKVMSYMKEKKFSFPVAMSDEKIQNTYRVQGYPTKLLITPQGKYITIPFNSDWVNFIKQYSNL